MQINGTASIQVRGLAVTAAAAQLNVDCRAQYCPPGSATDRIEYELLQFVAAPGAKGVGSIIGSSITVLAIPGASSRARAIEHQQ
jgi:hypothetical protein